MTIKIKCYQDPEFNPIPLINQMKKMEKNIFCPGCKCQYSVVEILSKEVKCQDCGVIYRQNECILEPQKSKGDRKDG